MDPSYHSAHHPHNDKPCRPFSSSPLTVYAQSMKIKELGEFGLIERITRLLPPYSWDVVVGVGDDVAVLNTPQDHYLLLTCDIQVEGSHFLPDTPPRLLGRKAAAVNLSDIGAKGGEPLHFLASLALKPETPVDWVEEFYRGLRKEAQTFGADIIGGNLSSTQGPQVLDIFLMGRVEKERLLLRRGARPGDVVMVTGDLGNAHGGLLILTRDQLGEALPPEARKPLLDAFLTPTPRVKEGRTIASTGKATAMLDMSAGLAQDLLHICQASQVGVRIWAERLPISPALEKLARTLQVPSWTLALEGGEDYELCFTVPRVHAREVSQKVEQTTGTRVTAIGQILASPRERILVTPQGEEIPLTPRGWNHFREEKR